MSMKLGMKDTVSVGKMKGIPVSEIVPIKGKIFELIKEGVEFDDEVLANAHIKKIIRDVRFDNVIAEHKPDKQKVYSKETESVKNILKSINTLDKQTEELFTTDENVDEEVDNILSDEEQ